MAEKEKEARNRLANAKKISAVAGALMLPSGRLVRLMPPPPTVRSDGLEGARRAQVFPSARLAAAVGLGERRRAASKCAIA